jgi:transcriptional regulator with XRE-family HTH domain
MATTSIPDRRPTLPLFDLARERGWSNAELATRAGLSTATLDSLRYGRRRPGLRVIAGIRRAFPGHSLEELFGDFIDQVA